MYKLEVTDRESELLPRSDRITLRKEYIMSAYARRSYLSPSRQLSDAEDCLT